MQKGPYFNNVQYISPLPEGYLAASSQIASNYGNMFKQLGADIGEGIKKYQQNKAESDMLDEQSQRLGKAVLNYATTAAQSGDQEAAAKWKGLSDSIAGFHDKSLSKKRAILSGAMTEISLFEKGQEMAARQEQLASLRAANALAAQNVRNDNAYMATIMGGDGDISPIPDAPEANQNPAAQVAPQPMPVVPPPTEAPTAPILVPPPAAPAQAPAAGDLQRFAQPASTRVANPYNQFAGDLPTSIPGYLYGAFAGLGNATDFALRGGEAAIRGALTGQWQMPQESLPRKIGNAIGGAIESAPDYGAQRVTVGAPQPAPVQSVAPQVAPVQNVTSQPAPVQTVAPQTPAPAAAPENISPAPAESVKAPELSTKPGRIKDLVVRSTNAMNFVDALKRFKNADGVLTPEIDKKLREVYGVTPNVRIETQDIKDEEGNVLGTAVIANGNVQSFVQKKTAEGSLTADQKIKLQQEMTAQTVRFGDQEFLAPTKEEAIAFRESVKINDVVVRKVQQLIKLNDTDGVKIPGTDAYNEARALSKELVGKLRVDYTGPGAVNKEEYKMLADAIADPTEFFSLASSNKTKLNRLLKSTNENLLAGAKSLNFKPSTDAQIVTAGKPASSSGKTSDGVSYQVYRNNK